jgi:hypothetical protein
MVGIMKLTLNRLILGAALAGAVSGLSLNAGAQPKKASADQCFLSRDVNGFSAPDNHSVYVRVGVSDIYRLSLMGDCGDLTFRQSIGLEGAPGGAWICSPLDATVIYRSTGIPERCPVSTIHKLTPEEIAALPKKDRP